jgi:preprotein translocase subunit SecB
VAIDEERVFKFEKTYVKDASLECPSVPEIFAAQEAQ